MNVKIWSACLALLCVMTPRAGAQAEPKWLTDAKTREARLPAPTDIASADGWFRARIPGKLNQPVVMEDGGYRFSFDLAEGHPVTCEVLQGGQDLGALLAKVAELTFGETEKLNGKIEARVVEQSDAGAIGPHAYISLRWAYRAQHQDGLRIGALTQFIADLDRAAIYCVHEHLGYVKTFQSAVQTVTADMLITEAAPLKPYFREVGVVSLDGTRVGVAVTHMARDADGDTKIVSKSAMLLQAAPGQLVSQDSTDVQWVRPDGSLINAVQAKGSGGALTEDMALKRNESGQWRASGTLNGKPVDAELPSAPSSQVEVAKARKQLMTQSDPVGQRTESMIWSGVDLTRLLPVRATVLAPVGAEGFAVREDMGGLTLESVLDKRTGTTIRSKVPLGPRTLLVERIYQQGDF